MIHYLRQTSLQRNSEVDPFVAQRLHYGERGGSRNGSLPPLWLQQFPQVPFVGQVAPVTLYLRTVEVMHIRHKGTCVDVYLCQPEGFYSLHTHQMYRIAVTMQRCLRPHMQKTESLWCLKSSTIPPLSITVNS